MGELLPEGVSGDVVAVGLEVGGLPVVVRGRHEGEGRAGHEQDSALEQPSERGGSRAVESVFCREQDGGLAFGRHFAQLAVGVVGEEDVAVSIEGEVVHSKDIHEHLGHSDLESRAISAHRDPDDDVLARMTHVEVTMVFLNTIGTGHEGDPRRGRNGGVESDERILDEDVGGRTIAPDRGGVDRARHRERVRAVQHVPALHDAVEQGGHGDGGQQNRRGPVVGDLVDALGGGIARVHVGVHYLRERIDPDAGDSGNLIGGAELVGRVELLVQLD